MKYGEVRLYLQVFVVAYVFFLFLFSCFICTQLLDIKYSYLTLIIYGQLYGFK